MSNLLQTFLTWFNPDNTKLLARNPEGKVTQIVEPGKIWRVSHEATIWFAKSHTPVNFLPGDWVRVVERQGTILFIEPLELEKQ